MKNKELKKSILNALDDDIPDDMSCGVDDDALVQVSGGISDGADNLENEYIKDETMLIVPII